MYCQYNFRFTFFIYGSSARSVLSDEIDDLSNSENDFGDDLILEWAKVRTKKITCRFTI